MQTYQVPVTRVDPQHVRAVIRSFDLTLEAKRADETVGFNPGETLLSALGSCLLTGLALVADLSQIPIDAVAIHLEATRQDRPPKLVSIRYQLWAHTEVSDERLNRLVMMAEGNSTVFPTLTEAVSISGTASVGTPPES